jgi:hypothetical protein
METDASYFLTYNLYVRVIMNGNYVDGKLDKIAYEQLCLGHCRIFHNQHKAHLNINMKLLHLLAGVVFMTVCI